MNGSKSLQDMLPLAAAFTPSHRKMFPRICGQSSNLQVSRHSSELSDTPPASPSTKLPIKLFFSTLVSAVQLATVSLVTAVTIIAWEDISSSHPMRSYAQAGAMASQQGTERLKPFHLASTVRGMAFGQAERQRFLDSGSLGAVEPASTLTNIPSYNEVMLNHRVRVRKWDQVITQNNVEDSVRHLQLALMHILKCERLAADYNWDELAKALRDPVVSTQLDDACDVLNRASDYLSLDARTEVGFDFGSCAWRHCGAFADAREAIDELDHLIGILGKDTRFCGSFRLNCDELTMRLLILQNPSKPSLSWTSLSAASETCSL